MAQLLFKNYFLGHRVRLILKRGFNSRNIFNPIDTGRFFDACVPRGGEKTPPPENQLLRNKNTFSLHEVKFCINLAWFWGIALIFSWILMNFGVFGIKMTEKAIFYKNWATCKLYTSKESWNHLEIDFLTKKYD